MLFYVPNQILTAGVVMPNGKPEKGAKLTMRDIINELIERTNSNIRRLRVLEERSESLTSRMNTLENTLLGQGKDMKKSLSEVDTRVTEESDRIIKIETMIKDIVNQLKRAVTMTKIKELEELIAIYNPLTSKFITKEEVERLIQQRMKG